MALFNREYRLLIGTPGRDGIEINDLRIVFSANASLSKSSNEATIRVYNLASSTSDTFEIGQVVQLQAGYTGQIAPIVTGDLIRIEEFLEGVDRVCELTVNDSLIALRDSKTSQSFAPGTKGSTVLAAVAANFGLPVRQNITNGDTQLPAGYAFTGRTRNALTEICEFLGLEWSAQQVEIQIINKGSSFDKSAVVLEAGSGLIGTPKQHAKSMSDKKAARRGITYGQDGVRRYTKTNPEAKIKNRVQFEVQGYEASALMNAALYPGAYVKLICRATGEQGKFFVIDECTYNGDTHGDAWQVDLVLLYPKDVKQNGK